MAAQSAPALSTFTLGRHGPKRPRPPEGKSVQRAVVETAAVVLQSWRASVYPTRPVPRAAIITAAAGRAAVIAAAAAVAAVVSAAAGMMATRALRKNHGGCAQSKRAQSAEHGRLDH